ncbi:MAG TPA: hypothetical protein VK524_21915 [Polyangiaceae bacterium]|nr:hypothetical protein [Polyangiaceae bacterium]
MVDSLTCSREPAHPLACELPEAENDAPLVCSKESVQAEPETPAPRPFDVLDAAMSCAGKLENVAVALLNAQAAPVLALLSGVKAGYELGMCMLNQRDAALRLAEEERAIRECRRRGGEPAELSETTLQCVMPRPDQPP